MEKFNKPNYYEGIMIDVRNTFISFGRFLEKNKIDGQVSIDDYESYLVLEDQQQKSKEYTEI